MSDMTPPWEMGARNDLKEITNVLTWRPLQQRVLQAAGSSIGTSRYAASFSTLFSQQIGGAGQVIFSQLPPGYDQDAWLQGFDRLDEIRNWPLHRSTFDED